MLILIKKFFVISQKLGFRNLWGIANSVIGKGRYVIPSLFSECAMLSSTTDKAKLILKSLSKNLNLDD